MSIPKRHCVKCDQPGTLSGIDPKKATYCKPCFVIAVKHKFASTIGKRRLFKVCFWLQLEIFVLYKVIQKVLSLLFTSVSWLMQHHQSKKRWFESVFWHNPFGSFGAVLVEVGNFCSLQSYYKLEKLLLAFYFSSVELLKLMTNHWNER